MEAIPGDAFGVDYENVTYEWDFGVNATPLTASGIGPHTVQWTTNGTKTVTCTASYQSTTTVETTDIIVSSCTGSIAGTIFTDLGAPISVNIRLYEDFNEDGIADGAFVRSITSNGVTGAWAMASIPPGHYLVAVHSNVTLISAIDSGSIPPDPVDPITILPDNPSAGVEAFKLQVRPGLANGLINLIVTNP